jgi:hypothetical protein
VLSIILAALLAAPLLTPASAVGATYPTRVVKAKKQSPSALPKPPKQKAPIVSASRHGGQKVRAAHAEPPRKRQDETITPNRGTVDPIGTVSRGQTIDIAGTARRSGQTCLFRVFFADKEGPVLRDIVPDAAKRCTASVTIPDRPGVVGDASIVLMFSKATSGKPDGSARQGFTIT